MSFLFVSIYSSLIFYDITLIEQSTQIISMHSFHLITQKLKIQVECKQLHHISQRFLLFPFSRFVRGVDKKNLPRLCNLCRLFAFMKRTEPNTKKISNFNGNLQYIEHVDISFERPKTKKNLYCKLSHLSIVSMSHIEKLSGRNVWRSLFIHLSWWIHWRWVKIDERGKK